ncbi:MAG: hypothetical protein ACK4M7_10705 [Burkholderiales bacterium]
MSIVEALESYGPCLYIQRVIIGVLLYLLKQPCYSLDLSVSQQVRVESRAMQVDLDYNGALDFLEVEMPAFQSEPGYLDIGLASALSLLEHLKGDVQTYYLSEQRIARISMVIPYKHEKNVIDISKIFQQRAL